MFTWAQVKVLRKWGNERMGRAQEFLLCPSLTMQVALRFSVPEPLVPAALGDESTGFGGDHCLLCVSCGHKRLCSLKKC